ncbi:hypothetical protein BU16DRAFT_474636 [Lophium mytilinum]|uniref:Methyltransferase domain-containing protein n=1 Tax=Lophium mytilinum TaxID=390894 RepID=A0A6A6RCK7_9PEZI|nr:hypothetical protein BU16DRAFT_474636 [Lophium mytilinum]
MTESADTPKWDPERWHKDKSHKPLWYVENLESVDEGARELLENYSGMAPEKVIPHIVEVRDRAFDIFPYPCIGLFRFLDLSISSSPQYAEILQRIKGGQQFLDMGCCFGQDIRKLVHDGAPAENLYGADLEMQFMELGYDLFLDKETLKTKFIASDIFDPEAEIKQLDNSIDIVHASSFFHLFDWKQSVQAAKRIVEILKKEPGALVIGRQLGGEESGDIESPIDKKTRYQHNSESFKKMWKLVGDETGSNWEVDVTIKLFPRGGGLLRQLEKRRDDTRVLIWAVRRV